MEWSKADVGWIGERIDGPSPELLVAVLASPQASPLDLRTIAADWARSLPSSAFVVFEILTDIGTRLAAALSRLGLPASRLLLVGIGDGGTVCLNIAFQAAPISIGVLIYDPQPHLLTPPASVNPKAKVRLVGFRRDDPMSYDLLGALVRRLRALSIDAQAAELAEPGLTQPAVRLGGAYLTELSASALVLPLAPSPSLPDSRANPSP
jgi:hypothetical protein